MKWFVEEKPAAIFKLIVPILLSLLTLHAMSMIDIAMIGRLENNVLAGVGLASNIYLILSTFIFGIGIAIQTHSARHSGANDSARLENILKTGIKLSAFIGMLLALACYFLLPAILTVSNTNAEIVGHGNSYLSTIAPTAIFTSLTVTFGGYWRGLGKPSFGLIALLIQAVSNAFFNYIFIFGNFGSPALGASGAGLSTTVSSIVGLTVHLAICNRRSINLKKLFLSPACKDTIRSLFKIIIPLSSQEFFTAVGISVTLIIVGSLGGKTLAAFTIIMTIVTFFIMVSDAIGIAATTIISKLLNEKKYVEARHVTLYMAVLALLVLFLPAILAVKFPAAVISIFTTNNDVITLAKNSLVVLIIGIWIECIGRILTFSLVSLGHAKLVFAINCTFIWLFRVPLVFYISNLPDPNLFVIAATLSIVYVAQTLVYFLSWNKYAVEKRYARQDTTDNVGSSTIIDMGGTPPSKTDFQ